MTLVFTHGARGAKAPISIPDTRCSAGTWETLMISAEHLGTARAGKATRVCGWAEHHLGLFHSLFRLPSDA